VQEILQTMVIITNLCRNFLQIFTGTYAVVKCKSDLSSFHFSLLILFYSKLFLSLFPKHGQTYYVLIITNMHMLPFSYPRLAFKNLADIKIRTQLNPKFGSEFCRLLSKFTKTQFELQIRTRPNQLNFSKFGQFLKPCSILNNQFLEPVLESK
jgi:hypothetical protein